MQIAYTHKKFQRRSMVLLSYAADIINEYRTQGFILTVRQLYYQLVSKDLIDNTMKSYKKVCSLINDARMCGLIDWESIEDRTRNLQSNPHWRKASEIIKTSEQMFALDKWKNQDYYPEVWIEKDALIGVISQVCRDFDVPFFACRGYNSQSEQWRAGQRFSRAISNGQTPIVFHLGDHDPSGLDMTRDNQERLSLFAEGFVEVRRLALNWDQVEEYNPPPNPAKMSDSRSANYVLEYGYSSWELDALNPVQITNLISDSILSIRDHDRWDNTIAEEDEIKSRICEVREIFEKEGI